MQIAHFVKKQNSCYKNPAYSKGSLKNLLKPFAVVCRTMLRQKIIMLLLLCSPKKSVGTSVKST